MSRVSLADVHKMPDIQSHDGFELVIANAPERMVLHILAASADEVVVDGEGFLSIDCIESVDLLMRKYVLSEDFKTETTATLTFYNIRGELVFTRAWRIQGVKATSFFDGECGFNRAYRCVYRILSDLSQD